MVHCTLVQMGSQDRKMEQGSKKGRGEVSRMGMLNWKEGRVAGLDGVVGGHSGQV